MMISGITAYTPIRQVQKVNFTSSIWVQDWVKEHCGLTNSDISSLKSRCPYHLDLFVSHLGKDDILGKYAIEGCLVEICYKDIHCDNQNFYVYCNCSDEYDDKKRSKKNFMKCINGILNKYSSKACRSGID